jgi:site-specific recombinase XerD
MGIVPTPRPADRRSALVLQSAIDGWLQAQSSANTRSAYGSDLTVFGRWCAAHGVRPLSADAEALLAFEDARRLAGDSAATMRRRWSALASYYAYAIDCRLATVNPTIGAARPRADGTAASSSGLSAGAVMAYRRAAAAIDPRLEALVALLVVDGVKVGEALALDIADVSRVAVVVRRRGEPVRVAVHSDTAAAIRRCIGVRRVGPVFVSERSGRTDAPTRLTRFGADHLIRQLRADAPTVAVTANDLRRFHLANRPAPSSPP